jgi:predicted AAA+ superfamily ATPase
MSGDIEGTKRVRDALDFTLKPTLDGFVEANMKQRFGNKWLHYASRATGHGPNDPLDVYGLLKTILDNWNEVFGDKFERKSTHKARRLVSQLFDARNATSHLSLPLADAECLSHMHAMQEIAALLKATPETMAKLKAAYDAQRGSGVATAALAPAPATAATAPKLDLPPPAPTDATTIGKVLKPWIEVALPHQDVIENRTKQSEFAADLFAVDAGHAEGNYASPTQFFQITYLTEGLRRVLATAAQRLAGTGGDPVIGLQTAFGGGKTHTMLALYHLACFARDGGDPRALAGMADLLDKASVTNLPKPKIAVFVGSGAGPDVSLKLDRGPRVYTVWGYLAWRLAGDAGAQLMAEAERARTSPGSALLVKLFKLAGPSLILLDELTMFARQLDDVRFEAFLSFIQSLTEAAKMAPGVLIVGSLPESNAEAGGDRGVEALRRMEQVFGRVQSPWLPASGYETYEIIRRRLFQPLDAEGEKARDVTVKAFVDMYRKNAAEFPPEAKDKRYEELLKLSYPIHPELFDRLSKDWATLDKFQRTRGVLRFLANVVGVLWHSETHDPLITPARVPVAHERVRASVLYPLDPAFGAVVDREVDGDGSLPRSMELNPSRRISQARAATRAARAVFLCSAPLASQPNHGVTGQGLRLACSEPGDQLAIFGEALRELTERAAFLYEEAGRYWFSTQPTLNRLADERARAFLEHEVDDAIVKMLAEEAKTLGGFARMFPPSDDPTTIDEAPTLSLAILGPATPHAGRSAGKSAATDIVNDVLTRCRSSQRKYRNTLMFVAADEAQLATAREVTRKALAWSSIVGDTRMMQQQLTQGQATDAQEKAKTNREGARRAIRNAWSHVLYAEKTPATPPGKAFDLEHLALTSKDRNAIPAAVYEKARGDDIVKDRLGPETLWLKLKDLWPTERPHLAIGDIAEWFAAHAYLPKLKDRVVLETAIRDAVAKLDAPFGFAERFDGEKGVYVGLLYARTPPEIFAPTALLVRPEVAQQQLAVTSAPVKATATASGSVTAPATSASGPTVTGPATPSPIATKPRRFYGSVEIDANSRPVKVFETVLSSVVMELLRSPGAKVKMTLEIEADAPGGFEEGDVGVVRDNTKQLKFNPGSTGFSD